MAVCYEAGVVPRGRLRVDVLGMNLKKNVVIVEVKSSVADFRSDKKWHKYLDYCTQMYFALDEATYKKVRKTIPPGVGIFVVGDKQPYQRKWPIRVARNAEKRELDDEVILDLALRMVYKHADAKRTFRKRK